MKKSSIESADFFLLFLLLFVLGAHYSGLFIFIDKPLLIAVSVVGTIPVVVSAFRALLAKKISIDLLASVALLFSLLAKEWTSAVFINLMLTSARIFQGHTERRVRRALELLLKLKPKKAKVRREGGIVEVRPEALKNGDIVLAELGERIPVDGTVLAGEASVDQSSLTGESVPVAKSQGDSVMSSSIVTAGSLEVRADKVGKETALERMIRLVEESQKSKPKLHAFADAFTQWYIVFAFAGAIVLFAATRDLSLVLAVLLVVCADDIAIAIPLAFTAAIGYAARRGIIIKGSGFLEAAGRVRAVLMDKTGTLTYGKLKVHEARVFGGHSKESLYTLASSIAVLSDHPSAKAILRFLKNEQKSAFDSVEQFREFPGRGAVGSYQGKKLVSGKLVFLQEQRVVASQEEQREIAALEFRGFSATLIGYDGTLLGCFAFADEVRPQSKEVVRELHNLGIATIAMVTGDNERIARRVAEEVGIQEVYADLLPEQKISHVRSYLKKQGTLMMVGDGVNDAASITLADVGVAMGGIGSDVAIESSDIVLVRDDLAKVPEIIRLSHAVMSINRQNFAIWGAVNAVGLLLVFSGILHPAGAAAYNFLTDFIPLLNSTRIFQLHLKPATGA